MIGPKIDTSSQNEDEISTANTEDTLLSRNSSETINSTSNKDVIQCYNLKKKTSKCSSPYSLAAGIVLLILGVCSLIWTPFEVLMNERLKMVPGLPPFDWWKTPPDEVLMRAYIFNVTNSEQFLNGTDEKLHFQEIGPLIYQEKLIHSNVTFNDNGTLTYTATRKAIFLPEKNTIDLNSTVIVPNWALLGVASYLSEENFLMKMGYNLMVHTIKPQAFVNLTINQLLWNFSDPILDVCQQLAPNMVPINNLGILSRIYTEFVNTVTVYIGPKYGHQKFFLIDKYDGSDSLPNWGSKCKDKLTNSTEGVAYPQFITKDNTLSYWRKTFCKNAVLHYERDTEMYGVKAFRYVLPNTTFDRTLPQENDCYKSKPILLDGLSDVSRCHFDFPIAASFPHFLYGNEKLQSLVTGLTPNEELHGSYLIVEPITGIPMNSRARSQSNLIVRKLNGFTMEVEKFSDLTIPMFWLEYNQVGLPWYISFLVYFQVNILPTLQKVMSASFLLIGSLLVIFYAQVIIKKRHYAINNKKLQFENEVFLVKNI